ncbi:TonB-dependent receptor, partial [Paraglaciecola sp.]|uniref:TonB-dependent receptor n=1 Tax=Paraglaciecola sp. TaxID=1920173 RepID=UPI00273EBE4C
IEYASNSASETTESALFGEISYALADDLDVTLGLRKYNYEVETSSAVDLPLYNTVFKGRDPDSLIFTPKSASSDKGGTLFKFNVSYRYSNTLMTYVTVSEGFRIGGANRVAACPDNIDEIENQIICALPNEQIYIADTTTNYELGIKSTWLQSRFHFNVALFNVDWEDAQVSGITENGAVGILTNAEGANSRGIEISSRAMLSDYLTAYTTYAYAKAELTADAPNIYGGGVGAYDGERLPGTAEHQFSLGLNYQTELWDKVLDLNYGLTAQSDVYSTIGLNYGGETLPGYGTNNINAKLSGENWNATFYVTNLFDKYSFISSNQSYDDIESGNRGDIQRSYSHFILKPRTVGIKFSYQFGM